jgi:hypothetical protein
MAKGLNSRQLTTVDITESQKRESGSRPRKGRPAPNQQAAFIDQSIGDSKWNVVANAEIRNCVS